MPTVTNIPVPIAAPADDDESSVANLHATVGVAESDLGRAQLCLAFQKPERAQLRLAFQKPVPSHHRALETRIETFDCKDQPKHKLNSKRFDAAAFAKHDSFHNGVNIFM